MVSPLAVRRLQLHDGLCCAALSRSRCRTVHFVPPPPPPHPPDIPMPCSLVTEKTETATAVDGFAASCGAARSLTHCGNALSRRHHLPGPQRVRRLQGQRKQHAAAGQPTQVRRTPQMTPMLGSDRHGSWSCCS